MAGNDDELVVVKHLTKKAIHILDDVVTTLHSMANQLEIDDYMASLKLTKHDEEYVRKKLLIKKMDEAGSKLLYDKQMMDMMEELSRSKHLLERENNDLKKELEEIKDKYNKLKTKVAKNNDDGCHSGEETDEC